MRLHLGPVPENPDFQPEATGWRPLSEPSAGVFTVLATFVGLAAGVVLVLLWMATAGDTPASASIRVQIPRGANPSLAVLILALGFLTCFLLLVAVHELLHAAVFPGGCFGSQTIFGCWPKLGMFYAHYGGTISRNRYVLSLLMPFLVLTIGPWLAELIYPTPWRNFLAVVSVLNVLFAGGDLLGSAIIAWQLPANAVLRNQGWKTWWRVPTVDVKAPVATSATSRSSAEAGQEV